MYASGYNTINTNQRTSMTGLALGGRRQSSSNGRVGQIGLMRSN